MRLFGCTATLVCGLVAAALAAEPGKAIGTITIDKATTTLSVAAETKVEGLFDSKKQDTRVTSHLRNEDSALNSRTSDPAVSTLSGDEHAGSLKNQAPSGRCSLPC